MYGIKSHKRKADDIKHTSDSGVIFVPGKENRRHGPDKNKVKEKTEMKKDNENQNYANLNVPIKTLKNKQKNSEKFVRDIQEIKNSNNKENLAGESANKIDTVIAFLTYF